jgi:hypothetical protein
MAAEDARPRKNKAETTGKQAQQDNLELHKREALNALIGEQVIHILGKPRDLVKLQVRPLWEDNYRVNVYVGVDVASARVAHSFFVVASSDGNVLASTPQIARHY